LTGYKDLNRFLVREAKCCQVKFYLKKILDIRFVSIYRYEHENAATLFYGGRQLAVAQLPEGGRSPALI
jgi:hypothetical protein